LVVRAVLSLAAAVFFILSQALLAQNPAPDVYLVTIDTLRADHVHCYGDDKIHTPALDSLALDGIRFAQAFTPSPITNTSHISILTGLLPSVHGVTDFAIPLPKTLPTWAELLKKNGYQTAAFIGAVVLDSHTVAPGLDRGFDHYDNFPAHAPAGEHWGFVERRGMDVVHRAETWMGAHPGNPRFVWVHLYDPHDPYEPPPPYPQTYDGEIAYADAALGDLLAYWKHENRYQNALIIVVGDHGEGLGEHGEQTHGIFLYDATTHVPLIVKLPLNASAKKVVTPQVQTTDILPTVLQVLGISPPPALANRSLEEEHHQVFGETDYPLRFGWAPLRAVRSDGFKFIEAPRPEFYDLGKDPAELNNEYEPWNKTVQQLRTEIASSGMRPPHVSPATGAVSGATLSQLKALGYLGPGDEHTTTNVPELSSLPDPKDKIEEQNLLHSAMLLMDKSRSSHVQSLLDKIDAQSARKALEAAITQSPGQVDARLLLAQIDFKSGDRSGAQDQLEAVLLLDSANEHALRLLGSEYLEEKRFGAAADLLEPHAQGATVTVAVLQLLAQAYEGLGRTSDAARIRRRIKASKR
jgi:choline-sulfatase